MEILLRPLCIQDAVPLAKMADNENVYRYLRDRFPSPYLPEHALSFIQCCRENEEDGMSMVRGVLVNHKLAGVMESMFHIDIDSRNAEIGYWLGQQYWGQGIAAKALHRFCTEVFSTHPEIWRLSASILAPNTASMRVADKAGFHEEAVLRQAAYKRETLMDLHIFAVLRNQWR